MPDKCFVLGCGSIREKGGKTSFFAFPMPQAKYPAQRNELTRQRQEKWKEVLKMHDRETPERRYRSILVCSRHFVSGKPSEWSVKDDVDWVPTKNLERKNISSFVNSTIAFELFHVNLLV